MKKILSLILCGILLVACGNSEKITSQDTNQDAKKVENKDTKTEDKKQSDWKWDLLVKDVLAPIIDTNYQKGSPTYDRKDLEDMYSQETVVKIMEILIEHIFLVLLLDWIQK